MSQLVLRPAAAADVHDAHEWYEGQQPGLGREFLDAVSATLDRITDNPQHYPVIHRDTRRALLRRFPYSVFYRQLDDNILVVAVFHARRDPKRWKRRR